MAGPAVEIIVNEQQYAELAKLLRDVPGGIDKASYQAVNKTARWVNTRVLKAITDQLTIKRKDIAGKRHRFGGVTVHRASGKHPVAHVRVTGKRIPVYRFRPRPTLPQPYEPLPKRGLTYKICKQGGRRRISDAFVARMRSGHMGVFRRAKRTRLPIMELYGPSIPHVASTSPELKRAFNIDATGQLHKNLVSQVDYLLAKHKARNG